MLATTECVLPLALLTTSAKLFSRFQGNEHIDRLENLCRDRALKAFDLDSKTWGVNVQPYSGSTANFATFTALLEPQDRIMGLGLPDGGHLTHGFYTAKRKISASSIYFQSFPYQVDPKTGYIDYERLKINANLFKPKMIICGGSAYPRDWDYAKLAEIAKANGALLMADIAHISGLVAAKQQNNPFEYMDIVTTTTHKSLRGPRSGVILWNDEKYSKPLNMAVFPGMQGGPLMHIVAAKAVAFREALRPDFKDYAQRVVDNARALATSLEDNGLRIVSGGTDNHSMLVDLTAKDVTGKDAEKALDRAYLTCNKNGIPFDKRSPFVTSGLRLGSPAGTTRGFGPAEFTKIGELIARVVEGLAKNGPEGDAQIEQAVRAEVGELCSAFPVYPGR